jgi:hypothetical protein
MRFSEPGDQPDCLTLPPANARTVAGRVPRGRLHVRASNGLGGGVSRNAFFGSSYLPYDFARSFAWPGLCASVFEGSAPPFPLACWLWLFPFCWPLPLSAF